LRLLILQFRGQDVKNYNIVNPHSFNAGYHGRRCVLCLLDVMLECCKRVCIHPLFVALW
jgi:hypothetical protein